MKKIILSAVVLAFAATASVKADSTIGHVNIIVQDSVTKSPVALKDLPEAIKTTLASETYKEWTPTAAFLVIKADKSEYYQVDVKKLEETASLKLTKEGAVIQ